MRKVFFQLSRQHTPYLLLGLLLSLLTIGASIALLALSGWFISMAAFVGLGAGALSFNYFLPAVGVRFFAFVRLGGRYAERLVTHDATFKVLKNLRVWFYQQVLPIFPFTRYSRAEVLNRLVGDIDQLDKVYLGLLLPLLSALIISILLFVGLRFFSVEIAWLIAGTFLLTLAVLPVVLAILTRRPGARYVSLLAALRAQWVLQLAQAYNVYLLNLGEVMQRRLASLNRDFLRVQLRLVQVEALGHALVLLIANGLMLITIIVAVPLVASHQLNGANLALILLAILGAFEALAPIVTAFQFYEKVRASARRIQEVVATPVSVEFPTTSAVLTAAPSLRIEAVNFVFSQQPVLNEFSATLAYGEHCLLTGPTGSGKSTLVQLLARFLMPTSGEIYLGDKPLNTLTEMQLREQMCIVEQFSYLFNGTVRDNLRLAKPKASDESLQEVLAVLGLEQVDLDAWLSDYGVGLSGGQLKRLSVARAFLANAPITVFDEPFEGLDRVTQQRVAQAMLAHFSGRTVMIVTHQVPPALRAVRRINLPV